MFFLVKKLAILLIRMYQAMHGAFYMGCCRFEPTCSHYAVEAIETRGLGMGVLLSAYRILRCHPFCKGGWDPVPPPWKSGTPSQPPGGLGPGSTSPAEERLSTIHT
jgi:putative membrane protein insertion efficiency factor